MNRVGRMTRIAVAVAATVLLAGAAHGQAAGKLSAKRADFSRFHSGVRFTEAGQTYQVLAGIHAVLGSPGAESAATVLAAAGLPVREVVESKGNFVIFKDSGFGSLGSPGTMALSVGSKGPTEVRPVVVNERSGALAILLGSVLVTVKQPDSAGSLVLAYDTGMGLRNEATRLVELTLKPGQDPISLANQLRADSRVEAVSIDILENPQLPQ